MRERILDAANELFNERGVQAVGVDEIVAQAGIAKMTLYKYFLSKDQLILAVLQRNEDNWWAWFEASIKQRGRSPLKQLLSIFDLLAESFADKNYCGAPFINAWILVAETKYPIHLITESFRARLHEYVIELARKAAISNPAMVARQLVILMMGANIYSVIDNGQQPEQAARLAKKMASELLKKGQIR
jgi:AcrR family transcriptional regulator